MKLSYTKYSNENIVTTLTLTKNDTEILLLNIAL